MGIPDLTAKSDRELNNWIKNHEEQKATGSELYRDLLLERARRAQEKQLLDFETSLAHLTQAALEQRCTSYGALAAASDVIGPKLGTR